MSSFQAVAKIEPRFDGLYRIGAKGDYQFTYVRLREDDRINILSNFDRGDLEAVKILMKDQADSGWIYRWNNRRISFSNSTDNLHRGGRYDLTRDGFIKNSIFLVVQDQKIIDKLYPKPVEIKDQYQIYSTSGELLSDEIYQAVQHAGDKPFLFVTKNNITKMISARGEDLTPYYEVLHQFVNGYAKFFDGSAWGLLDENGRVVVEPKNRGIRELQGGVIGLLNDRKWALYNASLKKISNEVFSDYKGGHSELIAIKRKPEDLWTLYDSSLKKKISNEMFSTYSVSNAGLIATKRKPEDPWNYMTLQGTKLPYQSSERMAFGISVLPDLVVITETSKQIILNSEGRMIGSFEPRYKSIWPLSTNRFIVRDGKNSAIVDSQNKFVLRPMPIVMNPISGSSYIDFKIEKQHGLMDMNGNVLVKAGYRSITNLKNGYFTFNRFAEGGNVSNAEDLYDANSDIKYPNYSNYYGSSEQDGLLLFSEDGFWGIINIKTHEKIIDTKYGYINLPKFGYFNTTSAEGKYKSLLLNRKGEVVYKTKYKIDEIISPELILVKHKNKMGLVNFKTDTVIMKPGKRQLKFVAGVLISKIF